MGPLLYIKFAHDIPTKNGEDQGWGGGGGGGGRPIFCTFVVVKLHTPCRDKLTTLIGVFRFHLRESDHL